jgi:hypothetical protein
MANFRTQVWQNFYQNTMHVSKNVNWIRFAPISNVFLHQHKFARGQPVLSILTWPLCFLSIQMIWMAYFKAQVLKNLHLARIHWLFSRAYKPAENKATALQSLYFLQVYMRELVLVLTYSVYILCLKGWVTQICPWPTSSFIFHSTIMFPAKTNNMNGEF